MRQSGGLARSVGIYALLTVACAITLVIVMELWRADLRFPFAYRGDAVQFSEFVKSTIDNGWYLENPYLGMPGLKQNYDWPMSETFHFIIIKFIGLISGNFAVTINLFFLLTFLLTVYASYYVFRRFSISPFLSYVGSCLYAFMGYHFVRNINHLFLSAYYMIPLTVMVILWLLEGSLNTLKMRGETRPILGLLNPKIAGSIIICLIVSACGVYYAYFACFFLMLGGAARSIWEKRIRPAGMAFLLVAVITGGVLLNVSPSIAYQVKNGKNTEASARVYHETELYSLKISELLLPVNGHRVKLLSKLKDKHHREISFIYKDYKTYENTGIGVIASIGFVFLLAFLLVYGKSELARSLMGNDLLLYLGIMNISALLLSTVGGFNSIFAHLIRYKIRSYGRISIYIAFFSLFAVLILLQNLYEKYIKDGNSHGFLKGKRKTALLRLAWYAVLTMVMAAGLYDQTGARAIPDYNSVRKTFLHDRQLVRSIERSMPEEAMIFQLPYVPYPESPPPYRMKVYDHLRYYLHTTKLKWSSGAMKGRPIDTWQRDISAKPAAEMVREIRRSGFAGIMINRDGYADGGEKIIGELKRILPVKPITSKDGTVLFFRLNDR